MNLTSALRIATGSLSNTSSAIATVSDNVAGVSNPNHVRREAQFTSGPAGTGVVQISRRVNLALSAELTMAMSKEATNSAVSDVYDRLATFIGDMAGELSPHSAISKLKDSIDLATGSASDSVALTTIVENARAAAGSINSAYQQIIDISADLDGSIAASVSRINDLLSQIHLINREISAEAPGSRRSFTALDQRDKLVNELAGEIGITVRYRENNDIAIFTTGGLTLYDRAPREVRFDQTLPFVPGNVGTPVFVDGVPITGRDGSAASLGKLSGTLQARDNVLGLQMNRLDEIARGLIETFAETDQTGGGKPPLTGLFTWAGSPALPPSGVIETGIGLSISVSPAMDPQAGGNVFLLRDGGSNGDPHYNENATAASGFSDRLIALSDALAADRPFDPAAVLADGGGVLGFAAAMVGAFDEERRIALDKSDQAGLVTERISVSLRSQTGPVLDNELAQLLELERSYQASAKIIAAVDSLLDALIRGLR